MKIRIKFRKYGTMKFIGHLDVMRFFQKAIRRAGIPIAYTEGFSPHQIMSFAAPLGVGLTSDGEYLDIVCRDEAFLPGADPSVPHTAKQIRDALNGVMVEEMEIVQVCRLPEGAGNAMASVAAARYQVSFREGYEPEFDWTSQLPAFYAQSTIPVTKKTKKSVKEFDLKPFLYELSIAQTPEGPVIEMLVDASSAGNVKPSLVIEAFYHKNGLESVPEAALLIHRKETYGDRGSVERHCFVPLSDFGEDFE